MPIVDIKAPELAVPIDTPKGFAVTPGQDDIDHGSEKPDLGSAVGAAFRQDNTIGAFISAEDRASPLNQEPGFNAWDAVKGTKYEPFWGSFVEVRNSRAADDKKRQIDREIEDRRLLDAAPLSVSLPAQMAAGVLDWPTLLPGGAFVRGAKGGISVARSALNVAAAAGASTAIQEGALQSMQETRPASESAINIGASVFLGGLLGAGGAKLLSRAEWNGAVSALERELTGGAMPVSGGAAPSAGSGPAPGFVRFFHGADADASPTDGGGRWVTPYEDYARNFRADDGPKRVYYVDIPKGDATEVAARAWDEIDERGQTNMVGHYMNIELPEEWAQKLQPYTVGQAGGAAPTSAGAAAVEPADIVGNAIAGRAASAVAASTSRLNPALRILQSPSSAVRDIGSRLFENSLYLKKNFDGVASEPAVETLMKEWNAGLATAIRSTDAAFSDYAKGGGQLSRMQFREAVGRAMRRGDENADPFVAKVANEWRTKVFDPLKEAAIEAKLLPEDVTVETAASYFSRMWNRNKLIAREGEFKDIVTNYYAGAIGKEYEKSAENLTGRLAKLDQEIADLTLPADVRVRTLDELETATGKLDEDAGDLVDLADRLSELQGEMRAARQAGDGARVEAARAETVKIKEQGGKDLKAYMEARSNLRSRRKNVDLGVVGLQERSDRILDSLADLEETNFRSMERLVKKGQKLERDLDRLDADALEERIAQLADTYQNLARRSEAAAERADKAVENIKASAERGTEKNRLAAERAATEAAVGPPEEAAAKLATAKEASESNRAKRAAADEAIQKKLETEAQQQRARAERMAKVAERLKAAVDLDHDALMAELKDAITKAVRETSTSSMARGARAARLGERIAALDPKRVEARIETIRRMKAEYERAFTDRWEVRNLGQGIGSAKPNFSEAARAIADSAHATLTGRVEAGGRPEFMKITTRGPMKDRTLNIPDELIEDFLESDVDLVGRRYARVMGADVELARKFGSPDLSEQLQKIRDDYARLRQGISDEKELKRLGEAEKGDIRDLEALRDLLRGTRIESPVERSYAAIVRGANHFNYIRSMGEVVLASLTDAIRPAMVHGLGQFMQTVPQLASNMKGIKLSVAEAQLAGNVTERVLGHRLATISEIIDPYSSRGPVEAFLENMTNIASKWNGIRIWTDGMKSIASVMTQNRILGSAVDFAKIKPKEKAYLAYLGIDESMAGRIAQQFQTHGEMVDGVKVANTAEWTDPVAVRTYRAAMNKDVDSIIVQKSVADVPLFAQTPTGKALLQFKSFALASHQRVLLRGLQEDQSRFVGGLVAMTAIGMLMTYLKAISGNRPETQEKALNNPGWWIAEGLDRSGVLSVPMELANTFEKATGSNPIKSPFKAFDQGSAISQKNQNRNDVGSLLGPTAGLASDIMIAGGIPKRVFEGEEVTQGQKNAAERLLPFNSYNGVRQILRYTVNAPE